MGRHQDDPVTQQDRFFDTVGDVDDGFSHFFPEVNQFFLQNGPVLGIQRSRGSSIRRTSGLFPKAGAMLTRCFMPPES